MCKKEAQLEGMSNRLMLGEFFAIAGCQVWKGLNKIPRGTSLPKFSDEQCRSLWLISQ